MSVFMEAPVFSIKYQKIKSFIQLSLITSGFVIFSVCAPLAADNGVTKSEILIGQSCALSGPSSGLGIACKSGSDAYFRYMNESGGIKGRKIKLISLDDGYDPEKCKQNTAKLIESEKVFLLFGYVGTPTSKAILPMIDQHRIPFFAPMTGAEIFRKPLNRNIFNIRASYAQETKELVDKLINEKKMRKIAVFYQDDDFGKSGLEGVKTALNQHGEKVLATGTYQRNTSDVGAAVKEISSKVPDAVIMIGTYEPCAEFIKQMRATKSKALYLNISFVGSEMLAQKLREKGEGIGTIISQVVPFTNYLKIPVVKEFNDIFDRYNKGADTNELQLEGYIAAKALCKIIADMPESMTREDFIKTAESTRVDFGGFAVNFDSSRHQASNDVFFTQIGPGGYLTRLESFLMMYEYNVDNPY